MLVFISWSGTQSKAVAEVLSASLNRVIQSVDPWISVELEKGQRWGAEVTSKLQASRIGIVCLTPENLNSPWLLFEAGAISNTVGATVCTLLVGVQPTDVKQPLGQFQHTSFDEPDMRRLIGSINTQVREVGERALSEKVLDEVFTLNWPFLKDSVLNIPVVAKTGNPNDRTEKELLQEALELLRAQDRRQREVDSSSVRDRIVDRLYLSELASGNYSARFARKGVGLPVPGMLPNTFPLGNKPEEQPPAVSDGKSGA